MMNGKDKIFLWVTVAVCAILCIASFIFTGIDERSKGNADERISEYVKRSETAQKLSEGIQLRTGELEEQMQSARNETSECIEELRESVTELGELGNVCDRIAEADRGIEVTADGIERRILVCLQILGTREEDEKLLEGNGPGLYDPGGR